MEAFAADWLNLLIRWAHLVAGVSWIGTSFYFVALDMSLRKRGGLPEGVMGDAWEVHGGGFYHVQKYMIAPKDLPDGLIWFKWEAYLTWVTGMLLMLVQFYVNAGTWLVDPSVLDIAPGEGVAISLVSLAAGWVAYDTLCRSPLGRNTVTLGILVFLLIVGAAYFFTHVFSARSALVHVGAFTGTMMAANVFAVIIPNQKRITASLLRGEAPDPALGAMGKQRSMHNTFLTLPVLVMMVSGHYPMITGHPHAWLIVALILVGGALARYFLLRVEVEEPMAGIAWTLPAIGLMLFVAVLMTAPASRSPDGRAVVSDARALEIVTTHCTACHAANPRHEGFDAPPKNLMLETVDQVRRNASLVLAQAVRTQVMPLGNETRMTAEERADLGAWLDRR